MNQRVAFVYDDVQVVHSEFQTGAVDFVADRPQAGVAVREVLKVHRVGAMARVPDTVVHHDISECAGFGVVDHGIGGIFGKIDE